MALTKAKKADVLKSLGQSLAEAETVTFVNFHGVSVAASSELRRKLREKGVSYTVARKTLIVKALNDLAKKPTGEIPQLEGEIALSYGKDQIWPAKGIQEFGPKSGGLKIVGGIFEGRYLGAPEMQALSKIPDQDTLYGQLLNLMQWPARQLVMTLDQIAKKAS